MITCGLDFGTTNSTIGYSDGQISQLINLSDGKQETRTVLLADTEENEFIVGNDAIKRYINGSVGRLLQSPKSFLNSRDEIKTIMLGNQFTLTGIVSIIIKDFKVRLENIVGDNVDSVLLGRPVHFHDEDEKLDKLAQNRLENAAILAGFKNIEFQLEPLAAAKTYQSTLQKGQEEKVIIADLGGGTSDFSLLHMTSDTMEVLGNTGVYIGGNNFDKKLSYDFFSPHLGRGTLFNSMGKQLEIPTGYYHTLSDWKKLHELGDKRTKLDILGLYGLALEKDKFGRLCDITNNPLIGYEYFEGVELTKKQLSQAEIYNGSFNIFTNPFDFEISRVLFEQLIQEEISRIVKNIKELLTQTGLKHEDIDKIFLTGGSSFLPIVQKEIEKLLGLGKIVDNERFSSIGYGLTIESYERFR